MMGQAGIEQTRFWQSRELDGVELLHAHYIEQRFSPHVHEGFVFAVIEQGAHRFQHRGSEHLAPTGSMILINPDELHSCSKAHEQGWQYRAFYPDNTQVGGVLAELELSQQGAPSFASSVLHDPQLHRLFAELHRLLGSNASALQQQTAWREAIALLFQRHGRIPTGLAPGREPLAVARAKDLLASQLATPPSLEALAQAVNLSPFHFARVFRRATGLPPHAWLKQRRLEQARGLLKSGCTPLNVALQLGYADQSHLSRQFKQAYGVAPGEYRRGCSVTA
ncbi:AraC family ligand binding domain-containing protein [Pseudomonas sp. EA_105y_Pfl2_R69]|uniref:AraC family ligand binding domain-containing protein n=1 Tax=Pseudomonas sp. EA_105y_Pfl2_R69 TaxID=3088683 RepID=UPI00403F9C6E